MTYAKVNVTKTDKAGVGAARKAKVFVFDWNEVATHTRVDNAVSVLAFASGKYGIEVYADQKSIKTSADSNGDFNATSIDQSVEFMHPGNAVEIRNFQSAWLNKEMGAVIDYCDGTTPKIYGSPCAPLALQFKAEETSEKTNSVMTLKSIVSGADVADFNTTTTLDTVKGTPAANATTVAVAAGAGEYQLTTGTASAATLTDLTSAVDGNVYTLLGSGGTYPSTIPAASTNFLLKNGTTWTALAGAKITFKCFKDGAATYKFVEVSRV